MPNAWDCVPTYATAPDGTWQQTDQQCAVTSWQLQPTPTATASTAVASHVVIDSASEDLNYSAGVIVFLLAALVVLTMGVLVRQPR